MRQFSFDQQYRYMNQLCVYKGSSVFPSFKYVSNDAFFHIEPGQEDLIEDVAKADQVQIIGKDIDPTQPTKMSEYVPTLPALPEQQAEVNAADLVPSKPAPATVPATAPEAQAPVVAKPAAKPAA